MIEEDIFVKSIIWMIKTIFIILIIYGISQILLNHFGDILYEFIDNNIKYIFDGVIIFSIIVCLSVLIKIEKES